VLTLSREKLSDEPVRLQEKFPEIVIFFRASDAPLHISALLVASGIGPPGPKAGRRSTDPYELIYCY
jgi:hypothetical protein